MIALRRPSFPAAFALAVATVYAAAWFVLTVLPRIDSPEIVASALTLDLVVLVPALYYFLMVRRHGWPWITVVPVAVASYLAASRLVPEQYQGTLEALSVLAAPIEVAILAVIAHKTVLAVRGYRTASRSDSRQDVMEAIRAAARETVGMPAVAEILAFEVAVFYYALISWRVRPALDAASGFTCYKRNGYPALIFSLLAVSAIEIAGAHWLIQTRWSTTAAWVVTGLGLYGVIWVLGDYQALRLRPIELTAEQLRLRVGLRWQATVPLGSVRSFERIEGWREARPRGRLDAVALGSAIFELTLDEPIEARGVYGFRKRVDRIGFSVDEPERFETSLREAIERSFPGLPEG